METFQIFGIVVIVIAVISMIISLLSLLNLERKMKRTLDEKTKKKGSVEYFPNELYAVGDKERSKAFYRDERIKRTPDKETKKKGAVENFHGELYPVIDEEKAEAFYKNEKMKRALDEKINEALIVDSGGFYANRDKEIYISIAKDTLYQIFRELYELSSRLDNQESDVKNFRELLSSDPEKIIQISLFLREIESLRNEMRLVNEHNKWMMTTTITISIGLFALAVSVLLAG